MSNVNCALLHWYVFKVSITIRVDYIYVAHDIIAHIYVKYAITVEVKVTNWKEFYSKPFKVGDLHLWNLYLMW